MWLCVLLCSIAVCAAQDHQYVSTPQPMTDYEPPDAVLQNGESSLDSFPSEKVELTCHVPGGSDWTFTWFTASEEQIKPDSHHSFSEDGSVLTVTVQNEETYYCGGLHKTTKVPSGHSKPLQLRVSGNVPKPNVRRSSMYNPMFPGEKITFTCILEKFSGWEYLWYHNKEELPAVGKTYEVLVSQSTSGKYHCRARRGKGPSYSAESETESLEVSELPTPSLELLTQWPDVFETEIVTFSCEVDDLEWTYKWYRNEDVLQPDSVLSLDEEEGMLNITSVRRSDQGKYSCRAHLKSRGLTSGPSNITALTVYENLPRPTIRKDPHFNQMYVGETANLTCSVSVASGWEYLWYRDGNLIDSGEAFISVPLGSSDGGDYWCKARRSGLTPTGHSEKLHLDVLEIPTPVRQPGTRRLQLFPTESVTVICQIGSGAGWKYEWYKDSKPLRAGGAMSLDSDGVTLSIRSASAEHKGQYECRGKLPDRPVESRASSQMALSVYDKKPSLTVRQDPGYRVMYPGESVSFICLMDVTGNASDWEYMWFKDGQPLAGSQRIKTLNLTGTASQGFYKCQARRGSRDVFTSDSSPAELLTVKGKKPQPSIIPQPNIDQLYIGESATFKCELEVASEWKYFWSKDGEPLPTTNSTFTIDAVSLSHSGTYECKAERSKTTFMTEHSVKRRLTISEIPVPSMTRVTPWSVVFPTESVTLSCAMQLHASNWKYVWIRDDDELELDGVMSLDGDGTTLSIASASASHRGNYSCRGKLKSRTVESRAASPLTLKVYDKKLVVTLMQDPVHALMHTEDSVSFGCHVNIFSDWKYLWYKDDRRLATSGDRHNISSAATSSTGSYQCQVQRGEKTILSSEKSQAVRLDVKERPEATVILRTGWSEVFSTDSLMLQCKVLDSQDQWNYTWYKEEQVINLVTSAEHIVTPQDDPDQSQYRCRGIRGGRPSYSKLSSFYKTRNLLLKRRVLLSISGIIIFSIIAIVFGCILLRVFRKPAEKDENPEQVNLFPSLTQLKNFNDTPCPLVEYITDASLNAASNEDNGTVCSEATPLPISTQENGVMDDGEDKAESNGGLISFQH